jgi:hypothetical protein
VPASPSTDRLSPLGAQKRAMRVFCRRAELDAGDLRRAIDDVRPDALLVDVASCGALAAAEAWGGAWGRGVPSRSPALA